MIYNKTIVISKSTFKTINHILTYEPENSDECFGEDLVISKTTIFNNGIQMDIKCCGVQYDEFSDSNTGWTEAVLFNENGAEICYTEPSDEYVGEWCLEYNGDEYCVNVIVEE